MKVTEKIAKFIAETRFEDLPEAVVLAAKTAVLDTVGVALAAVTEPVGKKIVQFVRDMEAAPEATVLGSNLKTAAPLAALANGTLGHALDFDDTNPLLFGHASVTVLPAALAQGEGLGASGEEVLAAYVIGFEVASKLGAGLNMGLYYNGWHPTSVLGTMGAAASVARLRGLTIEQTCLALGCAASHASGLRANFGTMTKPLHAGLAAESGVRAASLAAVGLTAHPAVMEAPSGYGDSFSGEGSYRLNEVVEGLGRPYCFEKPGNYLKPYPCCLSSHPPVDAMRDLMSETGFSADDVERIDVGLVESSAMNLSYHRPKTGLEGKFSAEYCIARMLADGELWLSAFTDTRVNDPGIKNLLEKIHVSVAEGIDWKQGMPKPAVVTVRTRDGRTLKKRVDGSRGDAERSMTQEEVHAKFRSCAEVCLGPERLEEAISRLCNLEKEAEIRTLMALLARRAGSAPGSD